MLEDYHDGDVEKLRTLPVSFGAMTDVREWPLARLLRGNMAYVGVGEDAAFQRSP